MQERRGRRAAGTGDSRDSDWTPGQNSVKQALGGCIRYSLVPRQAINVMRSVFCPCIYLDRQCTTDFSFSYIIRMLDVHIRGRPLSVAGGVKCDTQSQSKY